MSLVWLTNRWEIIRPCFKYDVVSIKSKQKWSFTNLILSTKGFFSPSCVILGKCGSFHSYLKGSASSAPLPRWLCRDHGAALHSGGSNFNKHFFCVDTLLRKGTAHSYLENWRKSWFWEIDSHMYQDVLISTTV